jgi:site-specific DNA-adenine methylase
LNPTKKSNEFIQTPFNYTGSKYKLLPQLVGKFDYRKSSFVDVFTGGGSVYTNVLDSYNEVYINDVILPLIDIHKQLISRGQSFVDEVKKYCVAKDDALGYMVLRK